MTTATPFPTSHETEVVTELVERVRTTLRSEPSIDPVHSRIRLSYAGGDLTMEGEVPDIAAKKIALERAAAAPGVEHIVDRLRVTPAERMTDGQIRDLVCDALLQEPALADCAIGVWKKGRLTRCRAASEGMNAINVRIEDGIVTLDGDVNGLGRKRLAGVLAWWVPGTRDVVNGLGVLSDKDDSDEEITEAVRLVLEKDPFVDASQIRVSTKDSIVTLTGLVRKEGERKAAESDAWYVFAVDGVRNEILVRH